MFLPYLTFHECFAVSGIAEYLSLVVSGPLDQSSNLKQTRNPKQTRNSPGTSNRPGTSNSPGTSSRPGTSHSPGASKRLGTYNSPAISNSPGTSNSQGTSENWKLRSRQELHCSNYHFYNRLTFQDLHIDQGTYISLSGFKVHKNANFFGFDFEFCTISFLVCINNKILGKHF